MNDRHDFDRGIPALFPPALARDMERIACEEEARWPSLPASLAACDAEAERLTSRLAALHRHAGMLDAAQRRGVADADREIVAARILGSVLAMLRERHPAAYADAAPMLDLAGRVGDAA